MGGLAMDPADVSSNSPTSPSPTSTTLLTSSPIRIRDSVSRPRRSLLTVHFSEFEGKVLKSQSISSADGVPQAECPVLGDGFSMSLPSSRISAFLDDQEEGLEPTTPPSTTVSFSAPMAPRKTLKQRPAPRGKHRPRRLHFGEDDSTAVNGGGGAVQGPPERTNSNTSPERRSLNKFRRTVSGELANTHKNRSDLASPSDSFTNEASRRIRMRDLR
ncbi:hypothetical protein KP509_20G034800 [Ceratopteris richardii]|uniref:Uncharacterized protein n=1 Tax=Ceratopteris richardii TaxID=49495 RepID=A0A8T2SG48_CERRI|nr:hypothetical protein KP509_20G034800 [Ceratopteris richardii]